jgi:hypothetical protein
MTYQKVPKSRAKLQVTCGQSRALRVHVSKHNRRTADKIQKTREVRGASSGLIELFNKEEILTF